MKKTIITAVLAFIAMTVNAQKLENFGIFNHLGVGLEVGTNGIGVDVAAPITDYLQVRAGYNFFPSIKVKNIGVDISSNRSDWDEIMSNAQKYQSIDSRVGAFWAQYGGAAYPDEVLIDGNINANNLKFLLDIFPSKRSTFHFTVGFYHGDDKFIEANTTNCREQLGAITYYNQNLAGQTVGTSPATYTFGEKIGAKLGDYLIEPNGTSARATIKVNAFKPYAGIGFGRAVPKTRLSFAMDFGVQFWGTPKIFVEQSNGEVQIDENAQIDGDGGIIKTISKVTVYPCINFRINGRIF